MDKGRDDRVIKRHMQKIGAHGIGITKCDGVVGLVAGAVGREIQVVGEHPEDLHCQHVQREGKDIYWLADGSGKQRDWDMTFRAVGAATIWQPEDGFITPLPALDTRDGHTQCLIRLDRRQGFFAVFDPTAPPQHGDAVPPSPSKL